MMRKVFALDHPDLGIQVAHWGSEPMTRWVGQRADRVICGPVALANILKYYEPTSYTKRENEFKKALNFVDGEGTSEADMVEALRLYGFAVRPRVKHITNGVWRHLRAKTGPVLLTYGAGWSDSDHYCTAVDFRVWGGREYIGVVNSGFLDERIVLQYVRNLTLRNLEDKGLLKAHLLRRK